MQTSQNQKSSARIHRFYHQPVQEIDPHGLSQILEHNVFSDLGSEGTNISFQTDKEEYFTLESSTATIGFVVYDSPAASISSKRSHFSQKGAHSCLSNSNHSPDNTYESPASGSSSADDNSVLRQKLRELEISLLGPEPDITNGCNSCFMEGFQQDNLQEKWDWNQMVKLVPNLNVKRVLIDCAQAISDLNVQRASALMHLLEQKVSVSGEPIERLGAYMLEGLRARLEFSGSKIYKALNCETPMSSDLMTYMGLLYQICPYWRFAYSSANAVILEAVEHEPRIHIIDFQIAQGSQWIPVIQALAGRLGGAPVIRITGVDDSDSAHARGGGLQIVGQRLAEIAKSCHVPFEFHDVSISDIEVQKEHLALQHGDAVVVNFPYILHHIPDESVNTWNHRDRFLRLVKSLSPKIVTLVELESNTNTKPFYPRFLETFDYHLAMFESIDVARPRDDKQRINAEQHCVARDIVNMIACEDAERVQRPELLGKWRSRFTMAGFTQQAMSPSAAIAVRDLLREYHRNYRVEERDGALYLWWKDRPMSTSSAWR